MDRLHVSDIVKDRVYLFENCIPVTVDSINKDMLDGSVFLNSFEGELLSIPVKNGYVNSQGMYTLTNISEEWFQRSKNSIQLQISALEKRMQRVLSAETKFNEGK